MTLAEDSGLFDSTPSEGGGAFGPAGDSEHEVALFDSPAADETPSGSPSDEETGLFGEAGTSGDSSGETQSGETQTPDADEAIAPSSATPALASRGTRRASGGRRSAKAERGRFHAPAKLAAAVAKLRKYEDTIVDSVVAADQLVRRLESRGVHADAGYPSPADFEYRIMAATPLLKGLREGLAASQAKRPRAGTANARGAAAGRGAQGSPRGAAGTRAANADRIRKTKALKSMATALARLRELDVAVQDAALAASEVFEAIEAERLFEECGYLSFEEFLERALGPSPVLASAVALAEFEPPLTPEEEPAEEESPEESAATEPGEPSEEAAPQDAFASALDEEPGLGRSDSNDSPAEDAPTALQNKAALDDEIIEIPGARKALSFPAQLVLTLVLCLAATFGGGAAGSWSVLHALAQVDKPESGESNTTANVDSEEAHTQPKARPTATGNKASPRVPHEKGERETQGSTREGERTPSAPKRDGAREPQASKSAAPSEIDPLAIPVVLPHPRSTGPREARR